MSPEAARTAHELQMLEAMVDCAHGLGMAFGHAATAEAGTKRSLELLDGYLKSFLAVRMGIRLSMVLRAPPRVAPVVERAEASEREPAEPLERRDSPERERERERDYEPVSLPKFLSTLGVVVRDAERLDVHLAPDAARVLPTLQALLSRAHEAAAAEPAPSQPAGAAVLAHPPQGATRRRLLGSAAPSRPGSRAPPPWTDSG